jgi:selenoprotein W-related protein|tara:strand:- start:401 stop:583 length:183 start_codon:yes stop_codon:yes gene_type:complete
VSLAKNLLDTYRQKITGLELIPDSGGCFEISLDGDLIYSKLKTGEFPDEAQILSLVEDRL